MKIKKNEQGQILVQIHPKERYNLLFHRLVKGKYEQYIKFKNKEYILSKEEVKEVEEFIKRIEV